MKNDANRPLRRNPIRTRRRLLEAGIRFFSAQGYHAVSVDQIVEAARVNKRMVYHFFGSKEALFRAALLDVYQRIEKIEFHAVEQGESPQEKLTRVLEGYFEFLDQNPEFVRLLLWENLEKGRHLAVEDHLLTKDPFMSRFRQIVEEGIASGDFHAGINIPHLMVHFIGLCFIYHSNRFSLSQSLGIDLGDPKVKARGLAQVLHLVFEGINVREAPVGGKGSTKRD